MADAEGAAQSKSKVTASFPNCDYNLSGIEALPFGS